MLTRPPPRASPRKPPPPVYLGDIRPVRNLPALQTVWKAMNLPGKAPPVFTDSSMTRPGLLGYQQFKNRRVYITPGMADTLRTLPFPGKRDLRGLAVLMHEYAHVGQPRVLPRRRAEGGAEAYAADRFGRALTALGVGPYTPGDRGPDLAYPQMTAWMARQPHANVRRAQFGR